MPFSFLMMSIVGAAVVAAGLALIPLVVHLLHKQKVTPVAWGAMQFLLESPMNVRRRRKIDNWLLMLVRMAILALLVFALCRPVWRTEQVATATPVDVAVVIDHSMTMGMRHGAGGGGGGGGGETLFDQGVDLAERLSRMLPPSGTMSIVLAENVARLATPTPLKMGLTERGNDGTPKGEWATLLQGLRSMKPGMTKGDIAAGVEAAREALTHGHNTRKIILVVSDDQRTNWNPGDEKEWTAALGHVDTSEDRTGAIPVFRVGLKPQGGAGAGGGMANATVRGILMQPAFLGVHRQVQIVATVSNTGGMELTNVPIVLEVDGKQVAARPLPRLAAGESAAVRFDYYFPEAGNHWVRVKADLVDALDADNAATAAVNIKPKLPVLVVDGQLTSGAGNGAAAFPQAAPLVWAMQPVDPALDQDSLIEPKVISVAEFATLKGYRFEDFPIVILNDVPRLTGELVNRLAAHAQAGNGVWLILGPRTEESFINEVLARGPLMPIKTKEGAGGGIAHPPEPKPDGAGGEGPAATFVTIDVKDPSNGALTLLTHGGGGGQAEHGALTGVTLRSWWSVVPVLQDEKTVLATTTGDRLVLEMEMGRLGGKAVVWTSAVNGDLSWNNFPLVAYDFLPLVNETLFNLAGGQDAGQPRQLQAGQPLTWTGAVAGGGAVGGQAIESVDLLCPDGSKRTLRPEVRGDKYYVEERDTALPGLYEMRFSAPARAGATAPPATYYSVNIDQDEMDPAVLSTEDLDWYKGHGFLTGSINLAGGGGTTTAPSTEPAVAGSGGSGNVTLAKALEATHGGMDIWWILGLLLLGLLVLEVLMTYVLVRQQAGKTLEEDGLDRVMPKGTVQGGGATP